MNKMVKRCLRLTVTNVTLAAVLCVWSLESVVCVCVCAHTCVCGVMCGARRRGHRPHARGCCIAHYTRDSTTRTRTRRPV